MNFHELWYNSRRRLLRQIQAQVSQRLGREPAELKAYKTRYRADFKGRWAASSREDLLKVIQDSRIVLGADFHAYHQSQRSHLRLLRSIRKATPVILCMECLESRDQKKIDRFMSHQLTEKEFLEQVQWNERWGFPWHHYRPLFDLAKKRGFKVLGINNKAEGKKEISLKNRDRFAAQKIASACKLNPKALIYVLFGDLHLAEPHLPKMVNRIVKAPIVVIHQNQEDLYFRSLKRFEQRELEVVRKGDAFCLFDSPPWVKWQSYLMFLEANFDVDLDEGSDDLHVDYTDHVSTFVKWACRDLDIEAPSLNTLAVFSSLQNFEWESLKGEKIDFKYMNFAVENDLSFYSPEMGLAFLSRQTINHAASLAGYFLHAELSGYSPFKRADEESFEAAIWHEAVGFFVSKLINHKRKAESLLLQPGLPIIEPKWRDAYRMALMQRKREIWGKGPKKMAMQGGIGTFVRAAIILGQMLGENLFTALHSGQIDRGQIAEWIAFDTQSPRFKSRYYEWIDHLSRTPWKANRPDVPHG